MHIKLVQSTFSFVAVKLKNVFEVQHTEILFSTIGGFKVRSSKSQI